MPNFRVGNKYVGISLNNNMFIMGFFPFVFSLLGTSQSLRISLTFFSICFDIGMSKTFKFE